MMRPMRGTSGPILAVPLLLAGLGRAAAEESPIRRLEISGAVGAHLFADDLELGVDDDRAAPAPRTFALFGGRAAWAFTHLLSAELELSAVPTTQEPGGAGVFVLGWRAHALVHVPVPGAKTLHPFMVAGYGALSSFAGGDHRVTVGSDTDFAPHWGLGVKVDLGPSMALRVDLRHMLVPNTEDFGNSSDFELGAGLAYRFGQGAAPEADPEPEPEPEPVRDADLDGIPDDEDGCNAEAEDEDGFEDDDGCPDRDNDQDGVPDEADKCATEKETPNGVDDDDGCPETDADQDGIFGSADKCADDPEDKDGNADDDGCPDLDDDEDGVPDLMDRCPAEKETANGYQDDDGCADTVPEAVLKFTGVIEGITFKKDSDEIKPASYKLLQRAVKVMKDYPDVKIEISGHTSSEGEHDYNVDLSKRRAERVKAYLVAQGIAADRMQTVGYGPDKPVADEKTRKGKIQNRSIQFKLVP